MIRVVVAAAFHPEMIEHLRELEPRLEVAYEPELLPDPDPSNAGIAVARAPRTGEHQARFDALVDSADVLLGVPDGSGRALARTVVANPRLQWVHTIPAGGGQQVKAAGLSRVDLDRIIFTTSAGVHAEPLAEFALFGVLAGAKHAVWMAERFAAREWGQARDFPLVSGSTVVVVGLGAIGRATAAKLAAVGCRVIGVHRREVDVTGMSRLVPVERMGEAFAEADAVVVALPDTDRTRGLVSAEVLGRLKPGATFVNVGRGSTVDEEALIAGLHSRRIGTAVLDVTAVEPLPPDSALWDAPNVILAPHTAARNADESRLIIELFADNARRYLDGQPLRNVVDTVEFY